MNNFLNESSEAVAWVNSAKLRHSTGKFGKLVSAVVWTDERNDDGENIIPIDPSELVSGINSDPYVLLHNHDPGCPKGQVLESSQFETKAGRKFVVAVLGFFAGGDVLSFSGLNIDTGKLIPSPKSLPILGSDFWIELAADPREVESAWLDRLAFDPRLHIKRSDLSHNSEEVLQELIRVGLPYVFLVWNPLITSIATEAGKSLYAAGHSWLRKMLENLVDRRNPVVDIQSSQDECSVSFLLRGKNIERHYAAHNALSSAATQAAQLVKNLKERGTPARELKYEFSAEALKWFPSFAILNDGRIVTDNASLIAIEQLPTGLSLGLKRGDLPPAIEPTLKDVQ